MTDNTDPDFTFANHGSIALLTPISDAASIWCGEHLPDDATRHGKAFAIEPRFADPILQGIEDEGLRISS